MGLFERLFGERTERVVRTDEGRLRVGADGLPRYNSTQRAAIGLAIDIREQLTTSDLGRPYGPGNGLEHDLLALRAVATNEGAVDEIGVVLMTITGAFIGRGRYTRDDLLAVMGVRPDGQVAQPELARHDPRLAPFCRYVADLWAQAVGLGGGGGPAVDEYEREPRRREQVAAWLAQSHARLDLQGTTSLPPRDALERS